MTPLLALFLMADPTGLSTFLDDAAAKGDIPGVVIVIQKGGKTIFSKAAGYADLESKRPIRVDDIFMMASTSKPIAATAILTLADKHKLTLDDKVQKYFPEFTGTSSTSIHRNGRPTAAAIADGSAGCNADSRASILTANSRCLSPIARRNEPADSTGP